MVNVDPSGEAVIAGRAAPNAKVELRDGGKTVAEATADASGQFVIIPPALAPGDHSLSLAASDDKAEPETSKTVAVSVPAPEAKTAARGGPARRRLPTGRRHAGEPPMRRPSALAMRTVATPASRRRRPRRHPVGRGRRRRRARRQGFGRAERDGSPLSQRRRRRRRQDAIGRPLVVDDQARHDPGRLCHARRRDQPERRERVSRASIRPFDYPEAPAPASPAAPGSASASPAQSSAPRRPTRWSNRSKPSGSPPGHTLWALSQQLLWRPDALPGDRTRRTNGANPQSQPHLSRRGVRRSEVEPKP